MFGRPLGKRRLCGEMALFMGFQEAGWIGWPSLRFKGGGCQILLSIVFFLRIVCSSKKGLNGNQDHEVRVL